MDIKVFVIGLVAGLLVGAGIGYGVVQSQTSGLQAQVTQLGTEKINLQNQVTAKTSEVNILNTQTSSLQTQIVTKNSQIATLQSQVATKDIKINGLESQIANLLSQIEEYKPYLPFIIEGEWQTIATFNGRGSCFTQYFFIPEIEDVRLRISWRNIPNNSIGWIQWIELYHKDNPARIYRSSSLAVAKTGSWSINPPLNTGYNYLGIDTGVYQNSDWDVTVEIFVPT